MAEKYTINEIKKFAASKRGKLLSSEYVDCKGKLFWQCEFGHEWWANWDCVNNGRTWCPVCNPKCIKNNIQMVRDYIDVHHPGACVLSTIYESANSHLLIKCENGHEWNTSWSKIKNAKKWCPVCAGVAKPDIEELHEFAESKGWKLLSEVYINSKDKLIWQCEVGHIWETSWWVVKNHHDCPYCAGMAKNSIFDLREHAKKMGGKLISKEYISLQTPIEWECSLGHRWFAKWANIRHGGTWCPACNTRPVPTLDELHFEANARGGQLLSSEYVNYVNRLEWLCKFGHKWKASWGNIRQGKWCPECARLKTEKECIRLAMQISGLVFKKHRIYYDPQNRKKFIEFDGYNSDHKIAIEYQGIQHYEYVEFYHSSPEDLMGQIERDRFKAEYCKNSRITLLLIPYTEENCLSQYISRLFQDFDPDFAAFKEQNNSYKGENMPIRVPTECDPVNGTATGGSGGGQPCDCGMNLGMGAGGNCMCGDVSGSGVGPCICGTQSGSGCGVGGGA